MEKDLLRHLLTCVGRRDTFAEQLLDGTYTRVFTRLAWSDLAEHLAGRRTIGTYLIDQVGRCTFAVIDADQEDGLAVLGDLRDRLLLAGIVSYLELSRRGGHLWIFFAAPAPADQIRAWLLPFVSGLAVEFYPKQGAGRGVGSLIRMPLGVHRRSGRRYPFVAGDMQPVARTLPEMLTWLSTVQRVEVPAIAPPSVAPARPASSRLAAHTLYPPAKFASIRAWNEAHDPFTVIGQYIDLDRNGTGYCPFGGHHEGGRDDHRSFQVYRPHQAGGYCWLCHAWQQGGSLFDFLRYWYGLDAKELWRRIQVGEVQA